MDISKDYQLFERLLQFGVPSALVAVVAILWLTNGVLDNQLLFEIDWKHPQAILETNYLYLWIHVFVFIPIVCLSFDRRVAFYKDWKYLFPAILVVAVLFILWDVFFTQIGVWGFNETYITGIHLLNLPIEEVLFFITVPFACVFIYECLDYYFPTDIFQKADRIITLGFATICFLIGISFYDHLYTSTTFLSTAAFLVFHYFYYENTYRTKFYKAFLVALIPFLAVNGILTGGYTQNPVVIYNPAEYLGIRVTSIPIDDSVYGFLMLFMVTTVYERLRRSTN